MNRCFALSAFVLAIPLAAQQPATSPQTLTGCVARIPSTTDRYVLAAGDRCLLLAGSYNPARIADHEIIVRGLVLEPDGMAPLTLNVQSVQTVRAACTRTCVLEPPGTRGIHGKERPGREGGTPGMHDPATPPSPASPAPQP